MANKRELKKWLSEDLAEQEKRNKELRKNLHGDTSSIAKQKAELSDILSMNDLPEPDDEEPIPDLFAAEREAKAAEQAGWDSFGSELSARKASEKQLAQELFGKPKGGPRRK